MRSGLRWIRVVAATGLLLSVLVWNGQTNARSLRGDSGRRQPTADNRPASGRPNILLLVSDDQSLVTFDATYMPTVFSELIGKGVQFTRGYDSSSLCCPSRSQILTGLFEHHTGVDDNNVALARPTIVEALHDQGYRTMLAGKYLNSAPCEPRPEFDQWECVSKTPSRYSLVDPVIEINGELVSFQGYQTDILASHIVDFINDTPSDQPFFILYTPTSPHLPANDFRYEWMTVPPYRPPSFDEDTLDNGKPAFMQRGPLTDSEIALQDKHLERMAHCVRSLDDSITTILGALGDRESNTFVLYLSDNGYLYGEHRRWAKEVLYDEAVHVPYVVRYPPLVSESQPFVSDALVENVDIVPTLAELAGFHWGADGLSLVPLLSGDVTSIRDGALIQHCEGITHDKGEPCDADFDGGKQSYPTDGFGIVTAGNVYIEYLTGEKELYDLSVDPYEITNVAGDPNYQGIEASLAQQLTDLRAPPVTDTTIVTGPRGGVFGSTFTFTYFSQSRLATYQCRLTANGVPGPWQACGYQSSLLELLPGKYRFQVAGTDEKGVADRTPESRSFTVLGP